MIDVVWVQGHIAELSRFWADDCMNHAAPGSPVGLAALTGYHRGFATDLAAFTDVRIDIEQQVAGIDRVAHLTTRARLADPAVTTSTATPDLVLATIRIDRIGNAGKIAEHWSVADATEWAVGWCGRAVEDIHVVKP
jgi:predicted ester cyclase